MKVKIDLRIYPPDSESIVRVLRQLLQRITTMSEQLDRLTTEVSETSGVIDSAIVLLNGLSQQLRDAMNDPAALTALADSLDSKQAELAAAITANTPA